MLLLDFDFVNKSRHTKHTDISCHNTGEVKGNYLMINL